MADKKKPDTAYRAVACDKPVWQAVVWDKQAEDAPRYIIGQDNCGQPVIVIENKVSGGVKLMEFTEEERERWRQCNERLSVVAAELEKMLTEGQPDHVREYRLDKLWEFGGLVSESAGFQAERSILINERIKSKKATEGRKAKSQKWHDIVVPLAVAAWRKDPDFPNYNPYKIARSIKNKVDVEEGTIGRFLSENEERVKNFG